MTCGAAFVFDPQSEAALRAGWQSVVAAGVSSIMPGLDYPPHMTLFLSETMDRSALRKAFQPLAAKTQPFPMAFAALGIFPGESDVVFLSPIVNQALLDLHAAFWRAAETHVHAIPAYYSPGQWVPHVTLAFAIPPAQLGTVTSALACAPLPRYGQITGILFGDFELEGGSQLETVWFGEGQPNL